MISRVFRAINNTSVAEIRDSYSKSIHNYEKYIIIQMETTYQKLLGDSFYISGLELMEDNIQQCKIELNFVIGNKEELCRISNLLRRVEEVSTSNYQRRLYFNERHESNATRCRILREKLLKMRLRLAAMVFYPLIIAMKSIMTYHTLLCVAESCKLRNTGVYVLTEVLLLILSNCNHSYFPSITVFPTKWHSQNIFYHPVIMLMEEKIDDVMYWQRHISSDTTFQVIRKISTDVFSNYEILYLEWVIINMMHTYIKWNHRYKNQLREILSLNGIGRIIYSFLITEGNVLSLMEKIPGNRKRKTFN